MSNSKKGRVARVIGPVVDIEFPADSMPAIFNALHVETTMSGTTRTLTLEVAQHIGDNLVRAISMQPTDGMVRGAEVFSYTVNHFLNQNCLTYTCTTE